MDSLDKRLKQNIKFTIKTRRRSLFIVLGSKAAQQIEIIRRHIKSLQDDEILWFNKQSDIASISNTSFRHVVLQDVEILETDTIISLLKFVQGGSCVFFLFPNVSSIAELKSQDWLGEQFSLFKRRLLLTLICNSLILDDQLNVIACNSKSGISLGNDSTNEKTLEEVIESQKEEVVKSLVGLCRTVDQANLLVDFLEVLRNRKSHTRVSVSSALGRGKSAALGLAIAGSLALNYSNIYLSSLCPSNVETMFKFILLGMDVLEYKEDKDYDLIQGLSPKLENALVGINIFRDHPQSVRFIFPADIGSKIDQAELVVVDEAASLPLPVLKRLTGSYVLLMASSVGFCATSPFLYNSIISNLSQATLPTGVISQVDTFKKMSLVQPVLYASEDPLEIWMNDLFCTGGYTSASSGYPVPEQCRLYCVSRDCLFTGSDRSESFLRSLVSVFSSAEREISSNFLEKLADSSDSHIFCLLPPQGHSSEDTVICALVVHLENKLPNNIVHLGNNIEGRVPLCFNEWDTKTMAGVQSNPAKGAHIQHFVTHPSYRKMGYGLHTFRQLQEFYEGKCISLEEKLPSAVDKEDIVDDILLLELTEVQPQDAQYFVVSFALTSETFRFWKKLGFFPIFCDKTSTDGEQLFFMVKSTQEEFVTELQKSWTTFRNYFFTLLSSVSKDMPSSLALTLLCSFHDLDSKKEHTKEEIDILIRPSHMKNLEKYCQNLLDFHSVIHIVPTVSKLYFSNFFHGLNLPRLQEVILLSVGLQFKTVDEISNELGLPNAQVHGLLNRTLRKLTKFLSDILEKSVEMTLSKSTVVMQPVAQTLDEELEEAAKKITDRQKIDAQMLKELDVSQYEIKGSEDDWERALLSGRKTLVSIKSIKKTSEDQPAVADRRQQNKNQKKGKRKR